MLKEIKVKFKLSKEKEKISFFIFLADRHYDNGRNFNWFISKHHSLLKRFLLKNDYNISKKELSNYIDDYYSQNENEIRSNLLIFSKSWKEVEASFLDLTASLFPGKLWPNGKYIAYLTIWQMYPRFLKDKTFQIPYRSSKKKSINLIIAHELLHFIFYDYFFKQYPKYKSHKYDIFVWHVSEIFNSIILKRPEWKKLLKSNSLDYPEHKNIITSLETLTLNTPGLIAKIIDEVKKVI